MAVGVVVVLVLAAVLVLVVLVLGIALPRLNCFRCPVCVPDTANQTVRPTA